MSWRATVSALLCVALLAGHGAASARTPDDRANDHEFAIIGHSFAHGGGQSRLEEALAASADPGLAFVVATGIKSASEPCSDALYAQRRDLFDDARRPVIVAPAASDWSDCKNSGGRPIALERLNRLRELFYPETTSLGRRKLALARLSSSAKFRSYAEHAQWTVGTVLYATINLPSNNNHYLSEAGRNSEFEDRAVANRFWLTRLFALARRKGLDALVLFSEGDVKLPAEPASLLQRLSRGNSSGPRDGYAQTRQQIQALAEKFEGKVLLVDTAAPKDAEPAITWRDRLGHVSVGSTTVHVQVTPGAEPMFTLSRP